MIRALSAGVALTLLTGCAAMPQKDPFLFGLWGGPHLQLLFEGGIATAAFDCAGGTIDVPVAGEGPFSAAGSYRAGQPGPVRVGQVFTSQRATYSGSVTKDQMNLTIVLEDQTVLGPFTLTKGAPGQLTRCL